MLRVVDDTDADASSATDDQQARGNLLFGSACGLFAAVGYTITNIALRSVADSGDLAWAMYISLHKAMPAAALAWGLIAYRKIHGLTALPPLRLIIPLVLTGLVMQFGGNLQFQLALSYCGLALTVPSAFATIIIGGAVLGRMMLNEPITVRSVISQTLLISSIFILSISASDVSQALGDDRDVWDVLFGLLIAAGAGLSYGFCGVMIRRTVKTNLTVSASLVLISTTGVVVFFTTSIVHMGWREILSTPWETRGIMLTAGVFNAMAFFAVGNAFRHLSVIQTNMFNGAQIAMAAVAAVLFFAEPVTVWLVLGTAATVIGLLIMDRS